MSDDIITVGTSAAVLVPMRVTTFKLYDLDFSVDTPAAANVKAAYVAKTPEVDIDSLTIGGDAPLQSDIYQNVRDAPYLSSVDPSRVMPGRSGMYVHWEIPKCYRTAQVGTGHGAGPVQFPLLPDRYLIFRSIRPAPPLAVSWWDSGTSASVFVDGLRDDFLVVDASVLRYSSDVPSTEDVEVTSSPFIDMEDTSGKPKRCYLGQVKPLSNWQSPSATGAKVVADLNLSSTNNPFFADFVPTNSSVFSFFDPLIHPTDSTKRLLRASVSYTVIGFRSNVAEDMLNLNSTYDLLGTLKSLGLDLNPSFLSPSNLQRVTSSRSICHGTAQGTFHDPTQQSTAEKPADSIQTSFVYGHPFAVGSNAVDALLVWLSDETELNKDTISMKQQLTKLRSWVLDVNDDLDSQLQAEDLLASNNFQAHPSGDVYHFDIGTNESSKTTVVPTLQDTEALYTLNGIKSQLNALDREEKFQYKQLFDIWWTLTETYSGSLDKTTSRLSLLSGDLMQTLQQITSIRAKLNASLTSTLATMTRATGAQGSILPEPQTAPDSLFYTQRDPTLFVAGAGSRWPAHDAAAAAAAAAGGLSVRIDGQDSLCTWLNSNDPWNRIWGALPQNYSTDQQIQSVLKGLESGISSFIEQTYQPALLRLVGEALSNIDQSQSSSPVPSKYFYAEDRPPATAWEWFPLFIEWEIEYTDIPLSLWEFRKCGPESRWGWAIKIDQSDPAQQAYDLSNTKDNLIASTRVFSGRSPIVPQTSASLTAVLRQVFARMNPDELDDTISSTDREQLLSQAARLDYLSTNMSGFTDQLLGRQQGTHLMPFSRQTESDGSVSSYEILDPALDYFKRLLGVPNIPQMNVALLMDGADSTPVAVPGQNSMISGICGHGQFRFSKMNIVDRWGQVVQGIRTEAEQPFHQYMHQFNTALFPALGQLYSVDSRSNASGTKVANTVLQRADSSNSFVQVPPNILQPARVNFEFMTTQFADKPGAWRPVQQHENPVFGYVILNSVDSSLQIFTRDGQFVYERIVISNQTSAVASRPFPNKQAFISPGKDGYLWKFVQDLEDASFASSVFDTLSKTIASVEARPGRDADTLQEIAGRPMALVMLGVGIELSHSPPRDWGATVYGDSKTFPPVLLDGLAFPVKIGDADNVFDGTYGIWQVKSPNVTTSTDYDTFLHPDDLPPLSVQTSFIDPTTTSSSSSSSSSSSISDAYTAQRLATYQTLGAIVDPFTPVHAYSALLPIRQLSIPHWAVARGLANMHAFMRAGPLLVVQDLPAPDPTRYLDRENPPPSTAGLPQSAGSIVLPTTPGLQDWAWLQPSKAAEGGGAKSVTNFNVLDVLAQPPGTVLQEGPFTITEGYLYMKRPFAAAAAAPGIQAE